MKKIISWALLLSMIVCMLFTAMPVFAADASVQPKAPVSVEYSLDEIGSGMAEGVVTVTLPSGHGAEDIYLYWGDGNGKLDGYTAFAPFKVSGNVVTHRIDDDVVVPAGAKTLLAFSYSDAYGMSKSYAECALPNGAAITDEALGTLLFEFQSISDIHITPTYEPRKHHSEHMKAMMEDIIKLSPNSIGIFNNGDTVNNGYDADYEEFLKIYNSYNNAPIMYSGLGNHELFRHGLPPTNEKFSEMKQAFWSFLSDSIPEDAVFSNGTRFGSMSFSFIKNDCKFIFLGTDVLDQNNLFLSSDTLAWVETELNSAKKGNPTFIIMHQPMYGTLAGTFKNGYGVDKNTAEPLKALLSKHPEVIMFNGHTHRDMNQYGIHYSADGKLPNIFGTSSVGYLARAYDSTTTETYKGSEGYYVYVYEDKVYVRGRDFLKGEWISSAQFVVDLSEDGMQKTPKPTVEAPLYGSTAELYASGNSLGGTVTCNLPVNNNATAIALFLSSADTGIIGSNPFATVEVNSKDNYFSCDITFAGVDITQSADYILAYSYSDTLGWSADCDVIDLKASISGGGTPPSGNLTMNKYSFVEGESILVTAHKNDGTSWIGFRNVASTSSTTLNYWRIADVGIGKAVDLSKDDPAFQRSFASLAPGVYEIAWISESGGGFKAGKLPEHTTTFVVHPKSNASTSGAVKTDKRFYKYGEPIYVTALKGGENDWIGMQLKSVNSGTKLWYELGVSGVNTAFDITDRSLFKGTEGTDYKFAALEEGTYKLAWLPASNTNFQSAITAENTVEFTVVDMSDTLALGVPLSAVVENGPSVLALNDALKEVALLKSDAYTYESWRVLMEATAAAITVRDDPEHTGEDIELAHKALTDAIAALVEASAEMDKPETPTDTDDEKAPSEAPTTEATAPDTAADNTEKSGCRGSVSLAFLCVLPAFVPFVIKNKMNKREE